MLDFLSPALLLTLLLCSTARAQDEEAETPEPELTCDTGISSCNSQTFEGLEYTPAQVMWEIITSTNTVTNDTFFPNGSNIACLLGGSKFFLNGEYKLGFIEFTINVATEGSEFRIPPRLNSARPTDR